MHLKLIAFVFVIIMILVYSIVRTVLFISLAGNYTIVEDCFSFSLLAAELFALMHAIGYSINLIMSSRAKDVQEEDKKPLTFPPPSVAILVAARHEPKDVLEKTFIGISNIRHAAKKIYFLDDSSDETYKKEAEELCEKYGLILFRREERHGAKAGIINDCLKKIEEKYVAVFDADQTPMPDFLTKTLPLLEANSNLAFIQTPQFYSNIGESRIARAAQYQQSVFYEYICEAKGTSRSMFCCGTNVVFRRDALVSVGGFDETVVTEDFATSMKLHMKGYESLYYNHVGVFGMGPESLDAYFKQQSRWAKGTVGVFRKLIIQFFKNPFSLSLGQWWEYFLSSTYYFVGIALVALMICPIVYVLFDVPSFFIHEDIYFSVFLPYFATSVGIFYFTLAKRYYSTKDLFLGQVLTYDTFPVYAAATFKSLLGIQGTFGITAKGKQDRLSYWRLWPQLTFVFLNFISLVWGINRYYYERDSSLLVNCFWLFYHWMIMMGIFYFNEESTKKI